VVACLVRRRSDEAAVAVEFGRGLSAKKNGPERDTRSGRVFSPQWTLPSPPGSGCVKGSVCASPVRGRPYPDCDIAS
jgi:hypothetical protein